MNRPFFSIPYYHDYLSPTLARQLLKKAHPVAGVPDLMEVGEGGGLETQDSLRFLATLYARLEGDLSQVLRQRIKDRKFIDERVKSCSQFNRDLGREVNDSDYRTILGLEDADGRVVFGPKNADYCRKKTTQKAIAPLPEYLKGPHVTLFGPPDSAKMAVNAMNAYHRKLPGEPQIVQDLLATQKANPMWGADDEDSKTPLHADLVSAAVNLTECFEGTLSVKEGEKEYRLAEDHLSLPIKRFPGLALPASFLFYKENPIPLHLYDFALHLFRNWNCPRALVFYVPKLENEEEAAYIHKMIATAEAMIRDLHPSYVLGTIRLMIVLENPRAIVRAHEIIDALHPYFAGASLGWHDYLASTARLFKEDSNYRIPVKADPGIVIKYVAASHRLVADVVGSRGGIKVGGMYGILPLSGNPDSMQVTLKGFFKDIITQLKRDLNGFWVAHPDFVRLGLALVEAWKHHSQGNSAPLTELVRSLLDPKYHRELLDFIQGADIQGLDVDNPGYVRSLIIADIKESDFIKNNHPDEIRYNVRQSLQYLADWLSGNGCVALPTVIDGIPVRVMDDLATAERSRWEVWHEITHGRFEVEQFLQIAHEEMTFIRRNLSNDKTAKWYPVAMRIMLKLMTDPEPAEFATELLIPFTIESIRNSQDPWKAIQEVDPGKFELSRSVAEFDHYFELCGSQRFAKSMARYPFEDLKLAQDIVMSFSLEEILTAAGFHGDIGQNKKSLDARAASEQAGVSSTDDGTLKELRELGQNYLSKFGFKFLVSAKGKSSEELLQALKSRIGNTPAQEMQNARTALWEITLKRLQSSEAIKKGHDLKDRIEAIQRKYGVKGLSVAINRDGETFDLAFGATSATRFQIASLSKTIGSAFALEYFRSRGVPLTASVNALLSKTSSPYRIKSPLNPAWADQVTLTDLMSHSALNMHYVHGIPAADKMPSSGELIQGHSSYKYDPVVAITDPGKTFQYSGGGFLVLEHLLEALEGKPVAVLLQPFFDELGLENISTESKGELAHGFLDSGEEVPGGGFRFPAFAAGMLGTAEDMARFLNSLTRAYRSNEGSAGISHDTSVEMLRGYDKGSRAFMGCDMGIGVFTAEAGPNRLAIHQGANEGFRAIFIQCFDGPDHGKGLVIFCNGDNRSVAMIAETAREVLSALEIQGIDFKKLRDDFEVQGLAQEQIVNLGYKKLIFDAFQPDLPEEIVLKGPRDPLAALNLAVGAKIVSVTNEKFARAENLISPFLPVFDPELFGRQGKIMDSWESVRHGFKEYDALELELARASSIRFVSLSTKFHDGNQPEFVRLTGLEAKESGSQTWVEILPKTPLKGHSLLQIDLGAGTKVFSHVRVEMFPDGGLSRLSLFGDLPAQTASEFKPYSSAQSVRFTDPIPKSRKPLTIPYEASREEIQRNLKSATQQSGLVDWASLAFGGKVTKASNEHYGPAAQVISPFSPLHMFDGMESARSRKPGHSEEVIIQLGRPTKVERVLLDFTYFVNNNPLDVSIHGQREDGSWVELAPRARAKAFAGNQKEFPVHETSRLTHVQVRTYPDGGINRIKVLGPAL